jgi:hypothetical protein
MVPFDHVFWDWLGPPKAKIRDRAPIGKRFVHFNTFFSFVLDGASQEL